MISISMSEGLDFHIAVSSAQYISSHIKNEHIGRLTTFLNGCFCIYTHSLSKNILYSDVMNFIL